MSPRRAHLARSETSQDTGSGYRSERMAAERAEGFFDAVEVSVGDATDTWCAGVDQEGGSGGICGADTDIEAFGCAPWR